MSGFYMMYAACYCCGRDFMSNPHRVPSFHNEPICQDCIVIVNRGRRERGLPEWPVSADAYEPESETSDPDKDDWREP